MSPLPLRSLSWADRPTRELIRLAWPITVSMLSFGVMTLVDTLFVSSLGRSALAGVGLGSTATFALYCFSFGLLRGTKTLVSQAVGAGRQAETSVHLWAALAAAGLLGLVTIGLGQLAALGLPYLAETEAAGRAARDYLEVRTLGAPLVLGFIALREHRYGLGDSRSPMVAGLAGNALNVALNWVMVMQLGWGVRGSALATLFGHGAELVVVAWAYRAELGSILPARRELSRVHLRALFDVGVPTGVQFLLEMGSFALLTTIVSRIGEAELAAHQIALQVIHFSFLPTIGVAEAAAVLAGQAVGARRDELVPVVAKAGLMLSTAYASVWTLAMPIVAAPIAECFTEDASLVALAVRLLWVAACFQIADGAAAVARGVLRGAGDVVVPARMGVLCAWVFTPPLAFFLGSVMRLGALGGWIGLLLEITTLAALVWWRIARGPWRQMAAASRDRIEADAVAA